MNDRRHYNALAFPSAAGQTNGLTKLELLAGLIAAGLSAVPDPEARVPLSGLAVEAVELAEAVLDECRKRNQGPAKEPIRYVVVGPQSREVPVLGDLRWYAYVHQADDTERDDPAYYTGFCDSAGSALEYAQRWARAHGVLEGD